MTTKNIQDVVAERMEELFQYYDDIDCAVTVDQRITAKEQAALWLERTLTQLVKEVEAGERDKNLHYIDHLFNFHHCNCDLTPPTSDEEK